jgi:hypothetical protein
VLRAAAIVVVVTIKLVSALRLQSRAAKKEPL